MKRHTRWERVFLAVGVSCIAADAIAVDIANAGFEDFQLRDESSFIQSIPQWSHPNDGRSGTINPGPQMFPNGAVPEGSNAAYVATGGLVQQLSATVQANTVYALTVQVGRGLEAPTEFRGYVVRLMAGPQVLATEVNARTLTPGAFMQVRLAYEVGATDDAIGQTLGIYLGSADLPTSYWVNTYFDQVTLNAAPVPEPSSAALMALGILGVIGTSIVRRRRSCR